MGCCWLNHPSASKSCGKGCLGKETTRLVQKAIPNWWFFLLHVLSLFPAEKVAAAADLGPNPCSAWPCLQSFVSHNDWPVISIAWHCPNDRTKQLWLSKMEYPRPLRDLTIKHEDFPALLHPQRVAGNTSKSWAHGMSQHCWATWNEFQCETSFFRGGNPPILQQEDHHMKSHSSWSPDFFQGPTTIET